tara:strand:- start:83 stop:529 length:447 start_codon:yes stop_codon:yes gene_type:complete
VETVFSKGAELWVLPEIENSPWRWSFEWSLNFQIEKSLKHTSASMPQKALEIFKEWEVHDFVDEMQTTSPWTLIGSQDLLPTTWVLISKKLDEKTFAKELDRAWEGLGKPKTRIFPSKEWTKQRLKGLKSKCANADATEIAIEKGDFV